MKLSNPSPSVNLAAPGAIGGTTPAAITGTTITGTVKFVASDAGSSAAPSVQVGLGAFGFYRRVNTADSGGRMDITANGTLILEISPLGIGLGDSGMSYVTSGAQFGVTLPAVTRSGFATTGLYFAAPNSSSEATAVGFTIAGASVLSATAAGVYVGPGATANVGGTIFQDFVDGASVSVDGTEDTLHTHTLQASQFATNGDKVCGFVQLAIVGHAVSTDRIRLYAAGTAIFDTAALNFPVSSAMTIVFEIIRVSSTVLRAAVFATTTSATLIPYTQTTEITGLTLTNTQIVALKSISTGANSAVGDVTAKLGKILWQPAA